jgi:hypothetical protein
MPQPLRKVTANISVVTTPNDGGWTFAVQITETNGQTRHSVHLSQQAFEELTAGKTSTPEELVRKSFEFLLERESKNQIIRQFELPMIAKYFSEYPIEIKKRLA